MQEFDINNDIGLQAKIFENYGFNLTQKMQRFNPLQNKKHKTSSLSFRLHNGKYKFKDFSLGTKEGDWYDLIAFFENTSEASEIFNKAKEICGYVDNGFTPSYKPQYKSKPKPKPKTDYIRHYIHI